MTIILTLYAVVAIFMGIMAFFICLIEMIHDHDFDLIALIECTLIMLIIGPVVLIVAMIMWTNDKINE